MSQLSYSENQGRAFVGMKGDASLDRVEVGSVETVAGLGFGLFVKPGTNAESQINAVSAASIIRGATLHRHVEPNSSGVTLYNETDSADVLRQGKVWMLEAAAGGTLAVDDAVYAMVDTAAQVGQATDAAGTNNVLVPSAVVRAVSTDPEGLVIVLVEINLPS